MAQRLIRKLDDSCKQPYQPTEAEWHKLNDIVNTFPPDMPRPNLENLQLYKPGSSPENPYGFKGQLAIREQFTMSDRLRQILEHGNTAVSAQEIEAAASASGMRTMLQDAVVKVVAGETTLEEVFRVVG